MRLICTPPHVPSWRTQEQVFFYYITDRTLCSFHLALTVYHADAIHANTVIPWYISNQFYKFSLIQDAQINTSFSVCTLTFAYASSFLLQTDCCS